MKIAINGIGVAGPALAWWLKHFGFNPVLFEKAPAMRTGGYIVDFWGVGFDIAEKMGLIEPLRKKSYNVDRVVLVDNQGNRIAASNAQALTEAANGRFFSIARSDIASTLLEACKGVSSNFGTWIQSTKQTGNEVIATLSSGAEESFDLVIGADGLHSHIRQQVFGPHEKFERSMGACVVALTLDGFSNHDESTYYSHACPQKAISRLSLRDDLTLFLFSFREQLWGSFPIDESAAKAALKNVFSDVGWEIPEILRRLDETKDFYYDRVSQIFLDNWSQDRIAVIGDAAGCISLLGGEGTGLAITEAYVLAGELYKAQGDYTKAFANYQNLMKPFIVEKQKAARKFLFFFAPKGDKELFFRKMIFKALNIPLIAPLLLKQSLRDHIALPEYNL